MTNIQIPARVDYSRQPVLTTEQIANFYGTDPRRITENFKRNEEHFTESVHYFKLEGEALKEFKNQYAESVSVGARAASLILWTKQGAFRHAKMLSTPRAWEVYGELEEHYFNGNISGTPMTTEQIEKLLFSPDTIITICRNWKADREKVAALTAENTTLKDTITALAPKAEYCNAILDCDSLIPITTIAKDYGMSGAAMNQLLRKLGIQYYQGGIWHLYQKYAKLGWAGSKTITCTDGYGKPRTKSYTCWTEAGRRGLYDFAKSFDVVQILDKKKKTTIIVVEVIIWQQQQLQSRTTTRQRRKVAQRRLVVRSLPAL